MSSERLIRWSGFVFAIGGTGIAVFLLTLYPVGEPFRPQTLVTNQSVLSHIIHTLGALAALLGLVGLYVRNKESAGMFGLIAFLIAFTGTAFSFTGGLVAGFVFPVVAAYAPTLLDPQGPFFSGPGSVPFLLTFMFSMVGYVLVGIMIWRAGILPRAAAQLLIVGAILLNLPPQPATPIPFILPTIGSVLFGLAAFWLGWALWAERPMARLSPEPR